MRKSRTKLTACILAIVMVLATVSMTSCTSYYSQLLEYYRDLAEVNNNGNNQGDSTNLPPEKEDETPDTEQPDVQQGVIDTDIKVEMDENFSGSDVTTPEITAGDIMRATSQGLRSTVSVYCTFEITSSSGNSFWNPNPTTQIYYSLSSGVVYKTEDDGSGFVITNYHAVYENGSSTPNNISDQIFIYLYGMANEKYAIPATFVGGSANYDLAVLRIDKSEVFKKAVERGSVTAITTADSDMLLPGEAVIAIGNPSPDGADGISATQGIVSVESEYITMTALDDETATFDIRVVRIDAPVNSGNSGGGVYNNRGELIGIVNAKIMNSNVENIGYAIPSNVVRAVADNIIDNCYNTDCERVMKAMMGITVITNGLSTVYDAESGLIVRAEQVMIYEITSGSVATNILKEGDIIKSISCREKTATISRQYRLIDFMLDIRVDDTINVNIVRDGLEMTVSIKLTENCFVAY